MAAKLRSRYGREIADATPQDVVWKIPNWPHRPLLGGRLSSADGVFRYRIADLYIFSARNRSRSTAAKTDGHRRE